MCETVVVEIHSPWPTKGLPPRLIRCNCKKDAERSLRSLIVKNRKIIITRIAQNMWWNETFCLLILVPVFKK